ncbi:unnamed protein product [Merluccius merluccius]
METGKPQSVSTLLYGGSVAVPTERKMEAQAPLTAVYIRTVPAPPQQLFPQAQFPVTPPREHATLRLAMPPLYTKDTLPFLRVHIAGGLQPLRQELSLATAIPLAPVARPKSAGKHVCPHCSRDCMKPSVLEKHLRCHTGERPYPCTTCRVSFKTQSNLYKHKRTQAHARLSTESEKSTHSSMGSQESLCGSSVCSSSLDCQVDGESGSLDEEVGAFPLTKYSCTARLTEKVHCWEKPGTDPERGPTGDPVQGKIDLSLATQKTETVQSPGLVKEEVKGKEGETKKQGLTPNRHLPLQRQEATLFFKEWEGSALRGKPHSHESTDSGFSESTDHNMDPLPECITEHHDRPGGSQAAAAGLSQSGPDPRDIVSVREQRSLEEHISKLISENSVVVEDKQLENVRPRKTVLSKQGSIDLPMRYTYKDSFHFDMRNNPAPIAKLDGNRRPMLQSSLQPVRSASAEQAPLTRSSSLPYSVALLTPEQSTQSFSCPRDYVTLIRRGSSGPANPTAFSGKSVDQQLPAHRPLVRQAAVDCNHATEGLFFTNSSMERPVINSDLSCDGGGGSDICGAQSNRKRLRKKAQKFTYNKWHTYKGGTFKKLYNTTKGGISVTSAAKEPSPLSMENLTVQSAKSLPGGHNIIGRPAERPGSKEKHTDSTSPPQRAQIPSDRKKQRTNEIPDLPFQMLPFDPGQLNPVQKVFHVQTADLQICLQIISDEQLALIESRMEKQAATSERRKKTQTQALNFTVPVAGAWENVAHQSMCDQREVDNMKIPPLPELQYMKLNSMDQADVSQAQSGEVKLLPQRSKERAWTHEKTGHNLHHPEGGPSLFPENNNKLCSASGEVNGGGGDDLVDPGTSHSDSRLQPLRHGGVGVSLIHSSSSRPTAPFDSADTPAGLARPQPSGPTHEGSLLVGGLASQKAPESQGRRSSPGQPDSAGPGLAQKSQEPREKDQQCVEETAQSGAQVGAGTALGLPALSLSQTWRGMSAGPGSRPADRASRSHLTPAGDGVNPPRPAAAATVNAARLCGYPGVGPDGRGQVCDQNPVSSPGVHSQRVCPADPNSVRVQADHPHQNPMRTQEMTLKPTGVAQASTRDTVSTHSSDTPAPTQSPLSAMKPSPCPHLPETLQSTLPAHAPNNNNNNNSSSSGAQAEEVKEEGPVSKWREGEVEGGGVTREHVAYGGDPLGGDGGGFPSSRYHHHHQEEEVVLSEAQLGGHQFTKVSSTANMWPLLPNCQGYQEDSSSDDDDEDKLIIEL